MYAYVYVCVCGGGGGEGAVDCTISGRTLRMFFNHVIVCVPVIVLGVCVLSTWCCLCCVGWLGVGTQVGESQGQGGGGTV